jgi:hypothetical protein
MQHLLGHYELGFRNVRLYVDTDHGNGSVVIVPKDNGSSKIIVGIDSPLYEAVSVLLHELYEAALIDLNTRYKKQPSFSGESSDFVFMMTHNELGEAHERVGTMLVKAMPVFVKAYAKYSNYED